MKSKVVLACLVCLFVMLAFSYSRENKETDDKRLENKVDLLSNMVSDMQEIMLEMMEKIQQNQNIAKDILEVMKNDKDIYNNNKEGIDIVIKSCEQMIKENDETLYNCKIKFKDEKKE